MVEVTPRVEATSAIGWEDTTYIGWENHSVDLTQKSLDFAWLFHFPSYYWSTQAVTIDGQAYEAKIDPESFSGITISRSYNGAERIHTLEDITIEIPDPDGSYTSSNFLSDDVDIYIWVNDGTNSGAIRKFLFTVISAKKIYDVLYLTLKDRFVHNELEKLYPDTELVQSVWASDGDSNLGYCMPVPFGTAYIPLPSIFKQNVVSVTNTTISVDATNHQINDSNNGFSDFKYGYITTSGFSNPENNGTFLVVDVTSGTLTLSDTSSLVDESAGSSVTVSQSQRYYVLGETIGTYIIDEVQSPESWPKSIWNDMQYSFPQTTHDSYRVFQAIIADSDDDGTADANGLFKDGSKFLPISTKYSRSDTNTLTNPAEILSTLVFSSSTINTSYYKKETDFNGAFPIQKPKYEWASNILKACNAALMIDYNGQRIVKTLVPTAYNEISSSNIIADSFSFDQIISSENYDGGLVQKPKEGDPQHVLYKYRVGLGNNSPTNTTDTTLDLSFIEDSDSALKFGTLYFERVVDKHADISVETWADLLYLNPDSALGISGNLYESSVDSDVIVGSITISNDLIVKINGEQFNHDLSIFSELTANPFTVNTDNSAGEWKVVVAGPDYSHLYSFRVYANHSELGAINSAYSPGAHAAWVEAHATSTATHILLQTYTSDSGGYIELDADDGIHIREQGSASSALSGKVILYAIDQGGTSELVVKDEAGNATTLSPHAFELFEPKDTYDFPWSYYSENEFIGKIINVDMYGAIREIEKLSGKKFIYLKDIPKKDWDDYFDEKVAMENEIQKDRKNKKYNLVEKKEMPKWLKNCLNRSIYAKNRRAENN
jgi:hypothetical protein